VGKGLRSSATRTCPLVGSYGIASMNRASPRHTDVLVLGSGLAGLWCALRASRYGSVTLITKKERAESNTNYAQGGIAAVLGAEENPRRHAQSRATGDRA